jgi:hypothetical protein
MLSRTTTGGGLCHLTAEVLLTATAADSAAAYGSLSALCTAGDCISRISYSTQGLPSILLQAAAPLPIPVLLPSFLLFGVLGMGVLNGDPSAHNKSGIAYQGMSQQPEAGVITRGNLTGS